MTASRFFTDRAARNSDGWRIGRLSRMFDNSRSGCWRCQTTWAFVKHHVTNYGEGHGMFPLCEKCWRDLTPAERLPYYRALYDWWVREGWEMFDAAYWQSIETVVLAGR